ncbi:MAG: hypothetical protein WD156_10990 [Acidimicrobiia bacterium]
MNSLKRVSVLALLALVVGACGSGDGSDTTTTTAASTTTSLAPTTTVSTTTTTAPTTTTTEAQAPDSSTLPDEAPVTWVGVTTDYEAVEVDTATGEVIRSLGQVATAEDVEDAECSACVNYVDLVWRTFDESHTIISECCEPAAGQIHVLEDSELPLLFDSEDTPVSFWTASPAPDAPLIAFLGYGVAVAEADDPGTPIASSELDYFPVSNAVWVPGEDAVRWLEDASGTLQLRTFDVATATSTAVEVSGVQVQNSMGLAVRSSGDMVATFSQPESEMTAFVLSPDGEVVEEFDLESGARPGGYDSSGTLLIYTDGDGVVRWLSEVGSGVLAEGYYFASW